MDVMTSDTGSTTSHLPHHLIPLTPPPPPHSPHPPHTHPRVSGQAISLSYEWGMTYIEKMLYEQLRLAVGKVIVRNDLEQVMVVMAVMAVVMMLMVVVMVVKSLDSGCPYLSRQYLRYHYKRAFRRDCAPRSWW